MSAVRACRGLSERGWHHEGHLEQDVGTWRERLGLLAQCEAGARARMSRHSRSAAHGGKAAARRGGGEVAHVQEQEEVSLLMWVHASSVD